MKWSDDKDKILLREIIVEEPYKFKPKSKERGNIWTVIATHLNEFANFNVNQRSVRDQFNLLATKYKQKQRYELAASGISPEVTEIDIALEEILEKMKEAEAEYVKMTEEKQKKDDKEKCDAEETRRRSLETYVETKKRKQLIDGESSKPKRVRSTGCEVMEFLKESSEKKQHELALREQQHETFVDSQNKMFELFNQQQTEQRNQFQHLAQQQNMQMQGFMHILNKLSEKL